MLDRQALAHKEYHEHTPQYCSMDSENNVDTEAMECWYNDVPVEDCYGYTTNGIVQMKTRSK